MRKHNMSFATRWSRHAGDRSNFPQSTAHAFVNNKAAQFAANGLLQGLLLRIGCLRPAPGTPEAVALGPNPEAIVNALRGSARAFAAAMRSTPRRIFF